jgi:hypothetical protein
VLLLADHERPPLMTSSALVAVLLGSVCAACLAAIVEDGAASVWCIAIAVFLIQDRLRFVALRFKIRAALAADTVWLFVVLGTIVYLVVAEPKSSLLVASAVTLPGPLLSIAVLAVALRNQLMVGVNGDGVATARESPYVADALLLAGGVFVALAITGGASSLATSGMARVLLFVYQPLFSLAYAGRILALRAPGSKVVRAWPIVLASATAIYGSAVLVVQRVAGVWLTLPDAWTWPILAVVTVGLGQVARAYHQGLADRARAGYPNGLVSARLWFAMVLVALTAALVPRWGINGFALASLVAFALGATVIGLQWRSVTTEV